MRQQYGRLRDKLETGSARRRVGKTVARFVPTLILLACVLRAASFGADTSPIRPAKPTPEQAAWQDLEMGMFIHFAPNTWQDKEGDDLSTPLARINPAKLDTDQWVRVAESMGAKYIILVTKHAGGFCLWQTDTTGYGIKNTPWRAGQGDVLAALSASCRKRGLKLGVYLSPRDDAHGAGVGGKCATPQAQEAYNKVYRQQLTEVLSRYGRMVEVWFDGSTIIEVGDILKKCAPAAMIFQGRYATIRWVGNEDGLASYPAWNALPEKAARSGIATSADGDPSGTAWLPNECDARMRDTWFWNTKNAGTVKSVDELMTIYCRSVGRGANLLLNNTPDTSGLIPEADARRAAEFGAEVRRRFGRSIAESKGEGELVEVKLTEPAAIDRAIIMEDISHGERVRSYVLEGLDGGQWRELCRGSAVGHKKIDLFPAASVGAVRWRCLNSSAIPLIRRFAVFKAETHG